MAQNELEKDLGASVKLSEQDLKRFFPSSFAKAFAEEAPVEAAPAEGVISKDAITMPKANLAAKDVVVEEEVSDDDRFFPSSYSGITVEDKVVDAAVISATSEGVVSKDDITMGKEITPFVEAEAPAELETVAVEELVSNDDLARFFPSSYSGVTVGEPIDGVVCKSSITMPKANLAEPVEAAEPADNPLQREEEAVEDAGMSDEDMARFFPASYTGITVGEEEVYAEAEAETSFISKANITMPKANIKKNEILTEEVAEEPVIAEAAPAESVVDKAVITEKKEIKATSTADVPAPVKKKGMSKQTSVWLMALCAAGSIGLGAGIAAINGGFDNMKTADTITEEEVIEYVLTEED